RPLTRLQRDVQDQDGDADHERGDRAAALGEEPHKRGKTSFSNRRKLSQPTSGGMPPIMGWNSAKPNSPLAFISSTNSSGVSTRYWPVARRASASVIGS